MVDIPQNWAPDRMGLVAIIAMGRASSLFFQGLLDGHPQIATLPTFEYIPKCLCRFVGRKQIQANEFENAMEQTILWGQELFGKKIENAPKIDKKRFGEKFLEYVEEFGLSRKAVFIAIYYAFSSCLSKEVGNARKTVSNSGTPHSHVQGIQMIVFQCHLGSQAMPMTEDFEQVKFIGMVRDPRASLAGPISKGSYNIFSWGLFPSSQYRFLKNMQLSGYQVLFVKHEDLHRNPEYTMKEVASFLRIECRDLLKESTFFFSDLEFDGSGLASKSSAGLFANKPNPEYAKNRWESILSTKDTAFVEWANKDLMNEFGYCIGKGKPTGTRGIVPKLDYGTVTNESGAFHSLGCKISKINSVLGLVALYAGLVWYLREAVYNIVKTEIVSAIIRLRRATRPVRIN